MNVMIYENLYKEAEKVAKRTEKIGQSVLGRDITAFITGEDPLAKVLIHGSIHAREFMTARLILDFIKGYQGSAEIWFIPFVNPDGVLLATEGLESVPESRRKGLIRLNQGKEDFSLWKANIRGVDLNVNFDALWGEGESNIKYRNYENYIGRRPFSEPETRALRNVTLKNDFMMTISYHTKGREIYWGFDNNYKYKEEALRFSSLTGYPLKKSLNSAGGYKDWFTKVFKRLGLTIEVGDDKYPHPLPDEAYEEIFNENRLIPELASDIAYKIKKDLP